MQLEFDEFYRATRDACLRAVMVSEADRPLAEELVSEAYTRAWTAWPAVRRHPSPAAWVVRTALNTRISWWRRRQREAQIVATVGSAATRVEDPTPDPQLLTAVRQLPLRQREVIALRVFLDLDTRTTAAALGIAQGTVTAHLARAVATLREHLISVDHPEV